MNNRNRSLLSKTKLLDNSFCLYLMLSCWINDEIWNPFCVVTHEIDYLNVVQAVYILFKDDNVMKLPYFIAIAGFICALFAISIPHLSALRLWLGFSTLFSLIYILVAFILSVRDGKFHFPLSGVRSIQYFQ